jgi:hypothetical protein
MSFMFASRIGFTFVEMIRKLVEKQVDDTAVSLVTKGVEMIVKMQIQCAREGCCPQEWQLENVGFEDTEMGDVKMTKLLDRQGDESLSTPDVYKESIESFVKQLKHLFKFTVCNLKWQGSLKAISKCTEEWWASWCLTVDANDKLPNEGDVKQLSDALLNVVQEVSLIALQEEEMDRRDHGTPGPHIPVELRGKRKREDAGVGRVTHPTILDGSGTHSSSAGPNNMTTGVQNPTDSTKTQGYIRELTRTIGDGRFCTRVGRAAARALLAEWKVAHN